MAVCLTTICLTLLIALPRLTVAQILVQPEQIHLAFANDPSEMMVTWLTQDKVEPSVVEYGQTELNLVQKGQSATEFIDGGPAHRQMYIHRVKLMGLKPGMKYLYHVGCPVSGWSDLFQFVAMRNDSRWSPVLAVFGDLGNDNAVAMPALQELAQRHHIDAVLHVGDFAYDMDTNDAKVGDAFMNQIQSVAAYVPYMTCVGNHENMYNFSNYKNRFSMPGGDGQNLFYSFNIGPAHIIAFSTEVYYYRDNQTFGYEPLMNQYKWLEYDLKEANTKRSVRPWIIVMGHKPMYCSNNDNPDENCHNLNNYVRVGLPDQGHSLEDLFYKYGVDLEFYAHEHSYERLWPVYNQTVCNGTIDPYTDPAAPVHIITGSGGNSEGQTGWMTQAYPWSAYRSDDYGYTLMTLINRTHLQLDQVSIDKRGQIIDSITLVKTRRSPDGYNCHKKKWSRPRQDNHQRQDNQRVFVL